jgi:hypothetical protein
MPEIRGKASIPPKPPAGVFGPRGDTRSFSNRGKESRGIGTTPPKVPTQDLGRRPAIPAPGISQRPAQPVPGISKQPLLPAPGVSQRQARPSPGVSQRPELPAPGIGKGTPQSRPARESMQPPVQPPRTPSVTFGGYRGANEAKGQSLRGQASRQSSAVVHPPAAPVTKGSATERKDGPRGSAPAGKDGIQGKPHR